MLLGFIVGLMMEESLHRALLPVQRSDALTAAADLGRHAVACCADDDDRLSPSLRMKREIAFEE
jgi:hypothetical protein